MAAVLRPVAAFVPSLPTRPALKYLYLATDVCILPGLIGWYLVEHRPLGPWGRFGFVLGIIGVAVVRSSGVSLGPEDYAIGATSLLVGVMALATAAWRRHLVPIWVLGALLLTAVLAPLGYLFADLSPLFAASGVTFSLGLAGLALSLSHTQEHHFHADLRRRLQATWSRSGPPRFSPPRLRRRE
jgi:hypothetical protein